MIDNLGGFSAVAAADVVLATCVGSGADSLSKLCFEMVLVDETAQSTEPSSLVPLTRGCRQLVLVGDHRQLRPTVISDEAAQRGLRLSLFERMMRHGVAPLLLDTQYRMHRSLAEFASARFYKGRLRSGTPDEARPQPRGVPWPNAGCSAALLLSSSPEEGVGQSKRNSGEAAVLFQLLQDVLAAGELRPCDIGVVSPYAAQVALLRQCADSLPNGRAIEVKTVDGFQGREKELILFSAVRSNRSGHVGFLSDARRLNVMLTRARRGLVVVGDPTTLVASTHWADWLAWVEAQQAVLECTPSLNGAFGAPWPVAGWRMPPRPPRRRDGSPSSDVDETGRRRRWDGDSGSDDEQKKGAGFGANVVSRRERRRREKEARRAVGSAEAQSAEAEWKAQLRAAQRDHDVAAFSGGGREALPPPPAVAEGEADWLAADGAVAPAASMEGGLDGALGVNATSGDATSGENATSGLDASSAVTTDPSAHRTGPSADGTAPSADMAAAAALSATHAAARGWPAGDALLADSLGEEEIDSDEPAQVERRREAGRLVRQRLASEPPAQSLLAAADAFISRVKLESSSAPAKPSSAGVDALLPNWCEARDAASGDVFYHCTMTGETCFQRPSLDGRA